MSTILSNSGVQSVLRIADVMRVVRGGSASDPDKPDMPEFSSNIYTLNTADSWSPGNSHHIRRYLHDGSGIELTADANLYSLGHVDDVAKRAYILVNHNEDVVYIENPNVAPQYLTLVSLNKDLEFKSKAVYDEYEILMEDTRLPIIDEQNNIYVVGRLRTGSFWDQAWTLLKFDSELNLLYTKTLDQESGNPLSTFGIYVDDRNIYRATGFGSYPENGVYIYDRENGDYINHIPITPDPDPNFHIVSNPIGRGIVNVGEYIAILEWHDIYEEGTWAWLGVEYHLKFFNHSQQLYKEVNLHNLGVTREENISSSRMQICTDEFNNIIIHDQVSIISVDWENESINFEISVDGSMNERRFHFLNWGAGGNFVVPQVTDGDQSVRIVNRATQDDVLTHKFATDDGMIAMKSDNWQLHQFYGD